MKLFNEAAPLYEKGLSEAGYDVKIKYNPNKKTKQKNRKRNIIRFNPPYSKNVVTKVGHYFLKLLYHKLHKIFKRNTVKASYTCTKDIKSIINCHNKNVLHQNRPCPNERKSNCKRKELCPLNGNCQAENIVYKVSSVFCSAIGQPLTIVNKKLSTIPLYTYF